MLVDLRFCIRVLFTLWHTITPLSALRNQSVAVADGKSNRTLARQKFGCIARCLAAGIFCCATRTPWVRRVTGRRCSTKAHAGICPGTCSFVYRALCVGGLLAVLLVSLNKRLDLWQRLVGAGVLQTFILAWAVVPLLGQIQQQPIVDAAAIAKTLSAPLVLWKAHLPSFVTYTQRPGKPTHPPGRRCSAHRIQHQEALHNSTNCCSARTVLYWPIYTPAPQGKQTQYAIRR